MSTHLLIAAAYLEGIPQGRKLVLMAIADSADEHTLESAPGLPKLRAWSGRSKSQVTRIVADLEASGYIARVSAGRLGRRAVYRVFPNGVPAIPHPDEVRDRYTTTAEPVENTDQEGRTDAPHRGAYPADRGAPMRPLQSSPSVSSARRPSQPVETGRSASGFPGTRASSAAAAEEARGIARRARGAANQTCPRHADMIVPCGRCANAAADATTRKLAAAEARRLIANARSVAAPTDTTQEPTP